MTTVPHDAGTSSDDTAADTAVGALAKAMLLRCGIIWACIGFLLSTVLLPYINLSMFLLHRQDRWLLLAAVAITGLCCVRLPSRPRLPELHKSVVLAVMVLLLLIPVAGHFWLLSGYDLSRDEQMASFDAAVFAHGHLVEPLPPFWRDHADALNTLFMYPAKHRSAWISSYLPFNAAFRALFSLIGAPWLVGPAMTMLGAAALWGCVRRLWPADNEAAFVGLALYAGSAQVLFAGMTSYAMPDHLALNLCWLWLFLRGTRAADAAALAVGFVATGLHQPLMHPMFVAPFIMLMVFERRWNRVALFCLGYALIGAFWLWWPTWMWSLVQAGAGARPPAGVDYMTRLTIVLRDHDPMGLPDMVANGLRFIAWQHLLLVPLLLVAVGQFRHNRMIVALAGGMVLTTLVMAVTLPYQGHGFGYRYLHGLIGNAILLAIYGWKMLDGQLDQWRPLLLRTTAAGVFVMLPVQSWMAHQFYVGSARVSQQLSAIDADYVVIGRNGGDRPLDLVFNPPMLDRRPVRLFRDALDDSAITAICTNHPTVVMIGNAVLAPIVRYYASGGPAARPNAAIAPRLIAAGCRVSQIP